MIGLGADWDFELLESLIQDRGDLVVWETALACPACRREDAAASFNEQTPTELSRIRRVSCDSCQGSGFIYRNATVVKGLLTQINAGNRQLIDIGIAAPGDCVFSPSLQAAEIHDMDKITLGVTDVLNEGEVIQRNAASRSDFKTDLNANEDRLYYASDGNALWCEDENHIVYDANSDFVLVDNIIRWVGRIPADGVFYTLKYSYFPEWIAYVSPLTRVDVGRSLQQRVVLRKKHVAFMNNRTPSPASRQAEQLELTGRMKI